MKKLLGIVLAGVLSVSCLACGAKEQKAVCTMEIEESGINYEITLDAMGDTVQTMTQITTVDLSIYTEDQIAMLEESMGSFEETYETFEGVQYEGRVDGDVMYEKIIIDMTNADTLESLKDGDLLPIEGETNAISLKKTLESLESQGWTVED